MCNKKCAFRRKRTRWRPWRANSAKQLLSYNVINNICSNNSSTISSSNNDPSLLCRQPAHINLKTWVLCILLGLPLVVLNTSSSSSNSSNSISSSLIISTIIITCDISQCRRHCCYRRRADSQRRTTTLIFLHTEVFQQHLQPLLATARQPVLPTNTTGLSNTCRAKPRAVLAPASPLPPWISAAQPRPIALTNFLHSCKNDYYTYSFQLTIPPYT